MGSRTMDDRVGAEPPLSVEAWDEARRFRDRVRSLFNIETFAVPGLTLNQRLDFVSDPIRFTLHASDRDFTTIWRAVERRGCP